MKIEVGDSFVARNFPTEFLDPSKNREFKPIFEPIPNHQQILYSINSEQNMQ